MRRVIGLLAGGLGVTATAGAVAAGSGVLAALGGRPDPHTLIDSPQFRDGAFRNPEAARWLPEGSVRDVVRDILFGAQPRRPTGPVPLVVPDGAPTDGLHVTWYGHASSLVEINGTRILFDPMWSDRASPSRLIGPKRLHAVPHRLDEVSPVSAVVISHDHYDHLDMRTVRGLARTQSAPFVVPLGVGAHLRAWGVPEDRIIELDWGETARVDGVRVVATPAQHFSGRAFFRNNTLWASWVVAGESYRVFYSGDTGYFDGFADVGREHGPFDLTLVQIGAYAAGWPDIHMTPEEGVATHCDVRGGLLVPVHWATFNLAPHAWADPAERVVRAARERGVTVVVPRPGERVDVAAPPPVRPWWRGLTPGRAAVPRPDGH